MSYDLQFNSSAKTISVSSQTACEWSCVVMRGNITLSKYNGVLPNNGSTNIRVFTYGTTEMFGDIMCLFKENKCVQKEYLSIEIDKLPFFYLTNRDIFLFGEETRSYIYAYYGTPLINDEYGLVPLIFKINDEVESTFTYDGAATYSTVTYMGEDLYDIILSEYNSLLGCVEICIVSKTNLMFNDAIIISVDQSNSIYEFDVNEVIINIKQNVSQNLPTLLTISPSLIFLTSNSPKQKINVTSLYQGERAPYYCSPNPPNTRSTQTIAYSNDVEEYLNSSNHLIELYKNDNLNVLQLVSEKNASHFILNMEGKESNDENIGEQVGYKLYVINSADTSCYQELEFFYDYIRDPNNFIEFSAVTGAYAYVDANGTLYNVTGDSKVFVFDPTNPTLSAQTSLTLYFTKEQWDLSNEDLSEYLDYVFVDNSTVKNVIFTIKSEPEWWKILSQSDYVKEVKKENELIVSLEDEIPTNENTFITLQNRLGATCNVYVKNEENIFANRNEYTFGIKRENDESYTDNVIISNFSINTNNEVVYLRSLSSNREIYYVSEEKRISSTANTIRLKTIKYENLNDSALESIDIVEEEYEIKYNQNINKYYINYSSIVFINGKKEKKDDVVYYFEGNSKETIIVSTPYKQNAVPWNIVNNGSGVIFDIYKRINDEYVLLTDNIPTFFPLNEDATIRIVNKLPSNNVSNGDLFLTPNNLISDVQDTSTIIFQQINSYKEVYLTINFASTNDDGYVNKYGQVATINKMLNLQYNNKISCLLSNDNILTLSADTNNGVALYYASYSKNNKFITVNNENVNFYIIKNYPLSAQTFDYSKTYISNDGKNVLYSGVTNSIINSQNSVTNNIISLINNGQELIDVDWELKNGFLTVNGVNYFPNTPVYNITKNEEDYLFFYNNILNKNVRQHQYFIIKFDKNEIININGALKMIKNYNNGFLSYVEDESFYEVILKSINFNNKLIKLEKGDIFISPNDGNQYNCYQDKNGNYLVNIPSMKFVLKNNETTIQIQNAIISENPSDFSYTYNGVKFYPILKGKLKKNMSLHILQSVDGSIINNMNNVIDEKDYYIIINNKKYSYNSIKEELSITPFICCELNNDKKNGIIKGGDFKFELLHEPYKKYVNINNVEYELIDNKLIYDSNEYNITTLKDSQHRTFELVVVGNFGYKVKEKPNRYYCIINNEKYYYENNTLNVKKITTGTTPNHYFKVTEKINEEFNFSLNLEDLLSSDFIEATNRENNIITNGFVESSYPVEKHIDIVENENGTHNIISEEYVSIPLNNIVSYNKFKLLFLDDTLIICDEMNCISATTSANTEISIDSASNFKTFKTNEQIECNLSNNLTLTINDYSVIRFIEKCVIKFNNDCVIQYKNGNDEIQHQMRKNELLYISNENCEITFTDVVSLTFIKYNSIFDLSIFKNIVIDNASEIYFSSIINGQEGIVYNNNIYYIHNNKVEVIDKETGEEKELIVYERYIFIKQINNNSINVFYQNEVENIYNNDNEKMYGYKKGNEIIPLSLNNNNINWYIYLPVYNIDNGKVELERYTINNLNIQTLGNVQNQFGQIINYCNLKSEVLRDFSKTSIDIENGHFAIKVDCYEVSVFNEENNQYTNTYYSNEINGYKFTINENSSRFNGLSYSIWDYYANNYIRQSFLFLYEGLISLDIEKEITINNINLSVDEKKYVQIDNNEILQIHSTKWTKIETNLNTVKLNYWDVDNEKIGTANYNISSIFICEESIDENNKTTLSYVEKYFIEDYSVFKSSFNENTTIIKEKIVLGEGKIYVEIENKYFYQETKSVTTEDIENLRLKVEYAYYQKYIVTLEKENGEDMMVLTPHSNTFLNANQEIQVASSYNIYDDNNEIYEFYCFYKSNVYNLNFGILTISNQSYEVVKNLLVNGNNAYVLYDINSCLTHNLNVLLSNENYGYAKKVVFENKIEKEHIENILIEINLQKNECTVNIDDENKTYTIVFNEVTYTGNSFDDLLNIVNNALKTEYDIKYDKTKNKIYINQNKYGKCRLIMK